jgi:hypothetical protein
MKMREYVNSYFRIGYEIDPWFIGLGCEFAWSRHKPRMFDLNLFLGIIKLYVQSSPYWGN